MRADAPDFGGGGGLARRRWEAERDGPSAMVISGPPPVLPTARRRPMRLELRARTGKALLPKDGDERLEGDRAKNFATQRHPYDVRGQILERLAPLPRKSLLETSTTPERPRALGLLRPRLNHSSNSNYKDDQDDDVDIYRIRTASNSSSTSSFAGYNDRHHHDTDKVDRLHYPELALCALHADLSTWRTRQQDAFRLAQDPARLLANDLTEPLHDHLDTARRVLEPSEASIETCLVSLVPVPDFATASSASSSSSSSSSSSKNPPSLSSSSELAAMRKLQHELGDDPMDVDEDENSRDAVDAANAATAAALVERVIRADAEAAATEDSAMAYESTMRNTIPPEMTEIQAPSVQDKNNNNNNEDNNNNNDEENDNENNKNNDDEAIGLTRVNCNVKQDEDLDAKQNDNEKSKHDEEKQETNDSLNAESAPQASAPALCELATSFDETKSKPSIKQKPAIDQRKNEQVDQEVIVIEDSDEDEAPESDSKSATSEHEAKSLSSVPLQPSMVLRKRKRQAQEATHDAFDDRKSSASDDEKVDKDDDVNEDAGDETEENLAERSRMGSHVKHRRTLPRGDIEADVNANESNDRESTNEVTEVSPSMDDGPSLAESAFRGDCKSTASNSASAPPKSAAPDSTTASDIAEGPKLPLDHAKSLSVISLSSMSSGSIATHLTDRYSQPPAMRDAEATTSNATAKSASVLLQGPQEVNNEESSLLRERECMEKEDLRGQVSALRLKVQALEIIVDNVRGEHSQAVDASAATSQSFKERIAVLHAEKETSASEASSLREALEQAHLKLQTANQDRQSAHERANQLLAVATQEKNDRAKIETIAQTMSSQLTGAENEAFRLQSQLQDESNRRAHLEREVLQVRSMVRAASMQCQRWESHVSEVLGKFDQQVRSLEGRRAKLMTVLDAQHRARLASARHTDELTSKIESLQKQASPRCLVCMHAPIAVCYVPCGHRSVCSACDTRIKDCPVCRAGIRERVRTYDAGV